MNLFTTCSALLLLFAFRIDFLSQSFAFHFADTLFPSCAFLSKNKTETFCRSFKHTLLPVNFKQRTWRRGSRVFFSYILGSCFFFSNNVSRSFFLVEHTLINAEYSTFNLKPVKDSVFLFIRVYFIKFFFFKLRESRTQVALIFRLLLIWIKDYY